MNRVMEMETAQPEMFGVNIQYGSRKPQWRLFPIPSQNDNGVSTLIVASIKKTNYSQLFVKRKDRLSGDIIVNDDQVYWASQRGDIVYVENTGKQRALSLSNEIRLGTLKELNPDWWGNKMAKKAARTQAARAQAAQSLEISLQKSCVLFICIFFFCLINIVFFCSYDLLHNIQTYIFAFVSNRAIEHDSGMTEEIQSEDGEIWFSDSWRRVLLSILNLLLFGLTTLGLYLN